MTRAAHHHAQRAWVRMLFDADFATAVRADSAALLPHLPESLRTQLAAADPRTLRTDPLLQVRTLRHLADELKISTLLYLHETRSVAALLAFYRSPIFHDAIETDRALVLALGDFLAAEVTARALTTPHLAHLIAIENAFALARRAPNTSTSTLTSTSTSTSTATSTSTLTSTPTYARAPGVVSLGVPAGALAALQTAEKYLFEITLMPALALCADAPTLALALGDPTPRYVVTVPLDGKVSLVDIDAPTHALLAAANHNPLPAESRALIDELVEAELLVATPA